MTHRSRPVSRKIVTPLTCNNLNSWMVPSSICKQSKKYTWRSEVVPGCTCEELRLVDWLPSLIYYYDLRMYCALPCKPSWTTAHINNKHLNCWESDPLLFRVLWGTSKREVWLPVSSYRRQRSCLILHFVDKGPPTSNNYTHWTPLNCFLRVPNSNHIVNL